MDKKSTPEEELKKAEKRLKELIPPKNNAIIAHFLQCYRQAVSDFAETIPTLLLFFRFIEEQFRNPFSFEPYHQKIKAPIDYYRFSLDFVRPLVDLSRSTLGDIKVIERIEKQLKKKENVILLANHQTEADPQAISILLEEKKYPHLAESIIYVAGERVVSDPVAIPFSMGCDLLCIYSKRYIDHPPELKAEKQLHNKKTMEKMSRLLQEGGKIIYVAPSGGRDRRGEDGKVKVAPFDPDSIEMFSLMGKKAKTPTHFYPLTLSTYDLLPPPDTIQTELGEARAAKKSPVHIYFSPEFDLNSFPCQEEDKREKRKLRADAIWKIVNEKHKSLTTNNL